MMTCYGLSYVDNCSLLIFLIVCVCLLQGAHGGLQQPESGRVGNLQKGSETADEQTDAESRGSVQGGREGSVL